MSREWKPGDVAMVTWRLPSGSNPPTQDMVGICDVDGDWLTLVGTIDGDEGSPTNPRPLVVIDPEDREQLARLGKAMRASGCRWSTDTQTALRSLVAPPKPDEPTGRYAVVVDADRVEWIRTREGYWAWVEYEGFVPQVHSRRWSEVDAVKVLSEGVTQ